MSSGSSILSNSSDSQRSASNTSLMEGTGVPALNNSSDGTGLPSDEGGSGSSVFRLASGSPSQDEGSSIVASAVAQTFSSEFEAVTAILVGLDSASTSQRITASSPS